MLFWGEFCKTKVDPITPKHISYSLSTQILFWETFKMSCFCSSIGTCTVDLVFCDFLPRLLGPNYETRDLRWFLVLWKSHISARKPLKLKIFVSTPPIIRGVLVGLDTKIFDFDGLRAEICNLHQIRNHLKCSISYFTPKGNGKNSSKKYFWGIKNCHTQARLRPRLGRLYYLWLWQ